MRRFVDWTVIGDGILRLGLGGVFLVAGVEKLLAPAVFAEQVANYQFWPESAGWIAASLPFLEVVTACVLMVAPRAWRSSAALLLAGMLGVFTAALGRAWLLGINVDCGCFGQGSPNIGPLTFLRNLTLIGAALALLWLGRPRGHRVKSLVPATE